MRGEVARGGDAALRSEAARGWDASEEAARGKDARGYGASNSEAFQDLLNLALELNSSLRLPDFIRNFVVRANKLLGARAGALALAQGTLLEVVAFHDTTSEPERSAGQSPGRSGERGAERSPGRSEEQGAERNSERSAERSSVRGAVRGRNVALTDVVAKRPEVV